jgi:hypothetical protein
LECYRASGRQEYGAKDGAFPEGDKRPAPEGTDFVEEHLSLVRIVLRLACRSGGLWKCRWRPLPSGKPSSEDVGCPRKPPGPPSAAYLSSIALMVFPPVRRSQIAFTLLAECNHPFASNDSVRAVVSLVPTSRHMAITCKCSLNDAGRHALMTARTPPS